LDKVPYSLNNWKAGEKTGEKERPEKRRRQRKGKAREKERPEKRRGQRKEGPREKKALGIPFEILQS
jgi:hypothetical protein